MLERGRHLHPRDASDASLVIGLNDLMTNDRSFALAKRLNDTKSTLVD